MCRFAYCLPIAAALLLLGGLPVHAEEAGVTGKASWYGGHHVGRRTASGEIFTRHLRTAAHKDLPLGTKVRVTNLQNRRSVVVRINDRGPYIDGRIIDLSERAARDLGMLRQGVAEVRLETISAP
jgi:rare lipoprotein A